MNCSARFARARRAVTSATWCATDYARHAWTRLGTYGGAIWRIERFENNRWVPAVHDGVGRYRQSAEEISTFHTQRVAEIVLEFVEKLEPHVQFRIVEVGRCER